MFLLRLFPANVCMCVCYIACENSAFLLRLFLAYVFQVLFREQGIKAVFSCWDFWVPNHAKIPRICCSCCRPTVVCCCLFVFIWGFVHLFFATSVGIFLFCVVLCLGHCMHMHKTWASVGKFHESIVVVAVVYLFMSCLTSASLERTRTCHTK